MLCFKPRIIFFLLCISTLGYAQNYPTQENVLSVVWENFSTPTVTPSYLEPFTDPLTGNTVTRISDESVFGCDCSQLRHIYAKKQAWNSDGTKIMTGGWPAKIIDGNTYEIVSTTYCRSLWSNTNPDITFDAHSNQLFRRNIVTQEEVILKTFTGYNTVSIGEGEGNLSTDDRYVALIATSGSQKTILVYDIVNDEIIGTKSVGTVDIDWVSVSQSGEYVVMSGYSDGSGANQGIKAYDKFMNNEIHLYSGRPHGDIGYDAQGNEVYIAYQGITGYSLSYARLDNGQKQGLFPFTGVTGDRGLYGGHISARNIDRPGWAYVSDQGHPSDVNRYEATREIFAIKLDASQTIERFAKHNSNLNVDNSYRHQAHAVPNRDGTKVIFASNWDRSNLESNSNGVLWVVEVPQTAGSQVNISTNEDILCEGGSTTLTASGALTYLWSTGAITPSIEIAPTETTTYTVTGVHLDTSITQDQITITVNENPIANAGDDIETCLGTEVTLTASGGSSYLWSTGETLASINVNPNTTTTYTVEVFENNCSSVDEVTVTVNQIPNVDAGEDQTIFVGETATLTAVGADSYIWSTGETTQTITVNPILDTSYSVTGITNNCENIDSVTVFLVDDSVNANAGADTEICQGESTILTATGGTTYLWSTGETTASIEVSPTEITTYTVTVYSASGTNFEDDSVIVTVNELPETNAGNDVSIIEGDSTTLTATGANTYLWSTGETTANITVSPTSTTTYTLTGFSNGCEFIDEVIVSVETENVNANAGADVSICNGESATLTATGGASYLWSTGENTASITVNPNETTTYTVTAFNQSATASNDDQVTVTVNELPETNAGNDVSILEGDSTTLTATGADTYLWSTGETTANIIVSPTSTTTYTVTGFSNDCEFVDEVIVSVETENVNANAGADVAICNGESTTLTATGGASYLWSTGETTASITVNPNETTTYTVTAFNQSATASNDDQVTVTVNELPETNAGNDVSIIEGDSTTLTATGADTYLWSTGETTANIIVSPTSTTAYTVTGFSNGCEFIDEVIVSVETENVNANAGADVSICNGESTTLTATGGASYLWSTGETTASITVNPNETTIYTVTAFNQAATASNDDQITVTVNELPETNAGNDVSILEGDSTTLTATGAETYLWSTGETTANITVSPTSTTTYTVTGFSNGCEFEDEVIVSVEIENVNANAGADVAICNGESITLTATGGASYLWSTGETTASITVNPNETTTYTVTAFNTNGSQSNNDSVTVTVNEIPTANAGDDVAICFGNVTTLTASGGATYLWSTGETSQNITVNPEVTTTFTVEVFTNNCSSIDEVVVNVNALPNTNAGTDTTITEGDVTTLTATGAESYLWSTGETTASISVNPTVTTTYSVTGVANGCESIDDVTVIVEPFVFTASAGANQVICQGYETTLTASEGDSYLWSTGETTQSITVNPTNTQIYTVTVYQGNYQADAEVEVGVNPNPNVVIANGDNVMILEGEFVTLSASGANTYAWNNGATQPNIAVSPSITTTYEVTGFINNCEDTKAVIVNVFETVQADAGEDLIICNDEVVTLTANGGDEYLWSNGETTQSIEVSPEQDTEYSVLVYNALDSDEDSVIVFVEECSTIEPPIETDTFDFMIYQDPILDILKVRIDGLKAVTAKGYSIYDLTGKVLFTEKFRAADLQQLSYMTRELDVSTFSRGVYIVKLNYDESSIIKKIPIR